MSVPVVAKFRRLLDSLPRETLPDVVASMIRTSNKEKLQVSDCLLRHPKFNQLTYTDMMLCVLGLKLEGEGCDGLHSLF